MKLIRQLKNTIKEWKNSYWSRNVTSEGLLLIQTKKRIAKCYSWYVSTVINYELTSFIACFIYGKNELMIDFCLHTIPMSPAGIEEGTTFKIFL